jgi:DUF2075 family protein
LAAYLELTADELIERYGDTRVTGVLGTHLSNEFLRRNGKRRWDGESKPWNNSLPDLAEELQAAGLGHLSLFIEFRMPPSQTCADVILAGTSRANNQPLYTLVELKQWTDLPVDPETGKVDIGENTPMLKKHPWKQVLNHVEYLKSVYGVLDDEAFQGLVYLHNATDAFMSRLRSVESAEALMFGDRERDAFREYLLNRYATRTLSDAARLLRDAKVRQPDRLLERASREFRENLDDRFVLLNEQQDAYEAVAAALKQAEAEGRTAIIVEGGPGTGKTAVGLKASGEAFRRRLSSNYIVWQESFRDALKSAVGLSPEQREQIFVSPRQIELEDDSRHDSMDLVICDEAHRLEKNTDYQGRTSKDPQISEILHLSRVHLFLLDRHQNVKLSEVGTPEQLAKDAEAHGYKTVTLELGTQMRSGGNPEYTAWARRLLGLDPGAPGVWAPDQDFPVLLAEQPRELWEVLEERTTDKNDFRIAAGYCWPWPSKKSGKKGTVKIGAWSMPWNYRKTEPDGPISGKWAYRDGGWGQVGCIHTFQGLEQKWVGVILGPDLVYRDGEIKALVEHNEEFRGPSSKDEAVRERAERLIRNIYYVLLTRGLNGIVIYACDDKLRNHLRTIIPSAEASAAFMKPETWERFKTNLRPQIAEAVDVLHQEGIGLPAREIEYVPGHEAILAWRDQRVAVLPDSWHATQAEEAINAYRDAGWTARQQSHWDTESLKRELLRSARPPGSNPVSGTTS